jgi:hypothetical protein
MNQEVLNRLANRSLVAAVTHDHTRIWLLNDGAEEPVCVVRRPTPDIRHVRAAQSNHGHASEISEVPYFNELASVMSVASNVVLVGHGVGKANAVNRFLDHLEKHRESLLDRVAATGQANIAALSGPEIVREARKKWARADR